MWVLINGWCKPILGVPGHETKILQVKNGQKVDDFEPINPVKNNFEQKRIVIFEHTINHISFGYVCLPRPEY